MRFIIFLGRVTGPSCQFSMASLRLPFLTKMLSKSRLVDFQKGDSQSLTPLSEVFLAQQLGLRTQDGLVPWAARKAAQLSIEAAEHSAWAYATPCHIRVSTNHLAILPQGALGFGPEDAEQLRLNLDCYFSKSGLRFLAHEPQKYLVTSALFKDLPTASFSRVSGQILTDGTLSTNQVFLSLQNEVQMFLNQDPVNMARENAGLPAINALWFWGTGSLPTLAQVESNQHVFEELQEPAQNDNGVLWAERFERMDGVIEQAYLKSANKKDCRISLCSLENLQTWHYQPRWFSFLTGVRKKPTWVDRLKTL